MQRDVSTVCNMSNSELSPVPSNKNDGLSTNIKRAMWAPH